MPSQSRESLSKVDQGLGQLEDYHLYIKVRHNRGAMVFQLSYELYGVTRTRVSMVIVSRRFHERWPVKRKLVVWVVLSFANRAVRLKWGIDNRYCSMTQWRTDEHRPNQ
ncbi:hypothetical protein TNCV_2989291 [Trichonephila clavipes]|nr:hypothetical protein TNCV_2989291 [Trichonephila clavipes]